MKNPDISLRELITDLLSYFCFAALVLSMLIMMIYQKPKSDCVPRLKPPTAAVIPK